ncbi:3'-5' exonuclease [Prorops nasuta]|uniref:3'-5' exonuclease n=1 Tax=Prorops nasuta TaxID=863751 RepID=UPI0034CEA489
MTTPGAVKNQKEINVKLGENLRRSPRFLPQVESKQRIKPEREPDISNLPSALFNGIINYTNDFNEIASICDKLIEEVEKNDSSIVPVGFDVEWPFSFQTGSGKTALVQICLSDKICHLLHVYDLKKLPVSFIILLSHPKVRLVGVNIKNDIWKVGRDFKEFPAEKIVGNNCIDCGVYANRVLSRSCRWSLERLTAYLLKKKINKDKKVRMSKWHLHPLSDAQRLYAATDAYISLLLHITIEEQEKKEFTEKKEDFVITV